jgi:hypothetical protein
MKPFGHLAVPFLAICAAFFPTSVNAVPATAAAPSEPQLVRVSYMQGDVRFNRGDGTRPDLKKPWEQADVNLPIENGFALATGADGRAEIEFESGSVIYVAENTVILFAQLTATNGTPSARLELVSGTITTGVKTVPGEFFIVGVPIGEFRVIYPESSFVRLDSYLDGMVFTPQAESGFDFGQSGPKKIHVAKGQTLTYTDGQTPRIGDGAQSTVPGDWDQWVAARYDARTTAMQAALKASGLSSPIPGLTDMYARGTFSACAPYGMCWEPSQETWEALAAPPAAQEPAAQRPATAQAGVQSGTSRLAPPVPVTFRTLVSECPFPTWYNRTAIANTPAELVTLSEAAYRWNLRQPWSWPVCHYARWIYRNHGYHVVVRPRRPQHPVHWVRDGKKTGFVPVDPSDQEDKPPVNLKHGIYTVETAKGGEHLEQISYNPKLAVETLAATPKEFRARANPGLAKAQPPSIEGRLLADAATRPKLGDGKPGEAQRNETRIGYDYGKGTFVRAGMELGGRSTKPVVVGSLNSRGSFSGSGGSGSSGRGGEGGSRGGAAAGGGGRESAAGRSSGGYAGSGGESASRGGSAGGSSGGSSGGVAAAGVGRGNLRTAKDDRYIYDGWFSGAGAYWAANCLNDGSSIPDRPRDRPER